MPWYILRHYHMPQDYPRTEEGLLDESRLAPHARKIPFDELKAIIRDAIASAARKSRREILELPDGLSDEQKAALYRKKGKELFAYFRKYYGDPAATAYDCLGMAPAPMVKQRCEVQDDR